MPVSRSNIYGTPRKQPQQFTLDSPGIYTATVVDAENCVRSASVLINGPNSQEDVDMVVNSPGQASFIPEFTSSILVDTFNSG